ncbi:stage II sporulation protein R [Proteiniborus sp.]|uniref:stage II sporulation protein R n=1 Tax=Proteiniborus sp. TaxID=2079015 RepID=UPI003324A665
MRLIKNYKRLLIASALVIVISAVFVSYIFSSDISSEAYKSKLIRLHVLANSDSPEDQELKLKVRDKIIANMNDKLGKSQSIDETREIVKNNIDEIKEIALKEIESNKKDYQVAVSLDNQNFPTKSYGGFTLPAGEYQALRVVIGEGKGQNWWCVMFPPLCFIDITNGLTDGKTKDELRKVLTEEEFNMIISARDEGEMPIILKSKVLELFEKGKVQFAKIFIADRQ